MALLADRVKETSTTTGTGTLTLAGAVTGFQSFASAFADADQVFYVIVAVNVSGVASGAWEVGIGTVGASGTQLARNVSVYASSNAGALVNFAAGTKQVFVDRPAAGLLPIIVPNGAPLALNAALDEVIGVDADGHLTSPLFVPGVDGIVFSTGIPGGTNPITMAGGDDGFGDAAIIFDNPTDGLVVLKFNQYAILNTAGTFLVETQGNISFQRRAGSAVLAGIDIQDVGATVYTGALTSANTSPITIGTGEAETSGNSGNITLITGMAGGGTRGSIALNAPSTVISGTVTATDFIGPVKFPTSDPGIPGAWWNNAGTLVESV